MITSAILLLLTWFIKVIVFILPKWTLWPQALTNGISYFSASLAKFNFIFPIDTLFDIIKVLMLFEVTYFTAKLILKIFNFFRGTGKGLDI
jgi:hypothetical protein